MILRPFKKIKEQKEQIERLLRKIENYERAEENRRNKEKSNLHQKSVKPTFLNVGYKRKKNININRIFCI